MVPRHFIVLSLVLFIVSLALPGLLFAHEPAVRGYTLLMWGWWGLLTGDYPWLANLFYFAAILFHRLRKPIIALVLCIPSIPLALLSLKVDEWWFNEGSSTPVTGLGPAFPVWLSSLGILALASLLGVLIPKPGSPPPFPGSPPPP